MHNATASAWTLREMGSIPWEAVACVMPLDGHCRTPPSATKRHEVALRGEGDCDAAVGRAARKACRDGGELKQRACGETAHKCHRSRTAIALAIRHGETVRADATH